MERRFACTACGKCCYGLLPLTIGDALAHADSFPLVMMWTPVRQGAKAFDTTAELGITIRIKGRKTAAVRISPTAYLPPSFPCPHLAEDGRCAIHDHKPQRCRTMPFSAYRDATDQEDLLIPRPGWLCDTSEAAPAVYRGKEILERTEFAAERAALTKDAAILRPYGETLLAARPDLGQEIRKMAMRPGGGGVLVAFSTLIPRLPKVDIYALAESQAPVMRAYAEQTAENSGLAAFHQRYRQGAEEWEKVLRGKP